MNPFPSTLPTYDAWSARRNPAFRLSMGHGSAHLVDLETSGFGPVDLGSDGSGETSVLDLSTGANSQRV